MTVTTTNSLGVGVTRTSFDQSTKLSAALNTKQVQPAISAAVDKGATQVSDTLLSKKPESELRIQAVGTALQSSKIEVLDTGASEVVRLLGQLQSITTRASLSGLSASERTLLDGQFQALRISINNVPPAPPGAEFNAASLAGASAKDLSPADAAATLGGFSDKKLLGDVNVVTEEAAQQALATITNATQQVVAQRATIERLLAVVDFSAASTATALQNLDAASASFDDLESVDSETTLAALLQQDPQKAAAAQTAKLPANILQLLA